MAVKTYKLRAMPFQKHVRRLADAHGVRQQPQAYGATTSLVVQYPTHCEQPTDWRQDNRADAREAERSEDHDRHDQ